LTAVVCTVTAPRAWLSADTYVTAMPAGRAMAPAQIGGSAAVIEPAGGVPPMAELLGNTCKITIDPARCLAVAGTGFLAPLRQIVGIVAASRWAAFDDVVAGLPPVLRRVRSACPDEANFTLLAVGWSPARSRTLGAAFASGEDDLAPHFLEEGHSFSPPVSPAANGYAELAARWLPAVHGEGVPAFHHALARAQAEAWRSGVYGAAACGIGGVLWTAAVSERGVSLTEGGPLDGPSDERPN
jgi:hypothetical protein